MPHAGTLNLRSLPLTPHTTPGNSRRPSADEKVEGAVAGVSGLKQGKVSAATLTLRSS